MTHPSLVVREVFPFRRWEAGPLEFGSSWGLADRPPPPEPPARLWSPCLGMEDGSRVRAAFQAASKGLVAWGLCWRSWGVPLRWGSSERGPLLASWVDGSWQPLICTWPTCGCHPLPPLAYPCPPVDVWLWGGQLCPSLQPESRGSQEKEMNTMK